MNDISSVKRSFTPSSEDAGRRLDQFLVSQLHEISRARIQELIAQGKVLVSGRAEKSSYRLSGSESIDILGEVARQPLRAIPEEIPLDVVYEDNDLAVINKPAGMMVHAGAGATEDARNRGTLVNALLYRFRDLSAGGGQARPGIVHRLDKETSGLMIVAKNDAAHRKLANQFSARRVKKTYLALVHGSVKNNRGTIASPISRDAVRRIRMTTRRSGGREALSHYEVLKRIQSEYGRFSLLRIRIDTGRTHQIRVHMSSIGHPVIGDTLYGAPREIKTRSAPPLELNRNFLHAGELEFNHPTTGSQLKFSSPLPAELEHFLQALTQNPGSQKQL